VPPFAFQFHPTIESPFLFVSLSAPTVIPSLSKDSSLEVLVASAALLFERIVLVFPLTESKRLWSSVVFLFLIHTKSG